MTEIITTIIDNIFKVFGENLFWIVTSVIGPLLIWYYSKRHFQIKELKDKEVSIESNQSDVLSKNLELYQRMLDDVENRYEAKLASCYKEIKELEELVKEYRVLIKALEEKNYSAVNQLINLKGELEKYEKNSNNR